MSQDGDPAAKKRLKASEAKERGRASRAQKLILEREIRRRDRRIDRLLEGNAEAQRLIEEGLETRSWRAAHRVSRIGRRLRGRGDAGTSAFAKASEGLQSVRRGPKRDGLSYLFVTGCARSGTTVTVDLLNSDPRVALGMERYKYRNGRLRKHHFMPPYFLNPTPDETNLLVPDRYRALADKLTEGNVAILGDKVRIRNNIERISALIAELEDVRFLYMLRQLPGVASSYNRRAANPRDVNWPETSDYRQAVTDWNGSLRALRDLHDAGHGDRVLVVSYERLYSDEAGQTDRLLGFMRLERSPEIERGLQKARRKRPEVRVGAELDAGALRHLNENADTELRGWAEDLAASPPP